MEPGLKQCSKGGDKIQFCRACAHSLNYTGSHVSRFISALFFIFSDMEIRLKSLQTLYLLCQLKFERTRGNAPICSAQGIC